MKTFSNLLDEVQEPGRCHHCGGCVTFCTAINYGALKLDDDGNPVYSDREKCIECGLCYMICPEVSELEEEVKQLVDWKAPFGSMVQTSVSRARDPQIRKNATDGGVVTALLLHLFDKGRIDGAIVTRQVGIDRRPWLTRSREEIIDAAGSHFDRLHGLAHLGEHYSTYSPSLYALDARLKTGQARIAFVGTPCQVKSARKMQALGIVPSDAIECYLGLFCTSSFLFDDKRWRKFEEIAEFKIDEVKKFNIKDDFLIHLKSGELKRVPLDEMKFAQRPACRYCSDFSAEFADISFGGVGSEMGWTTVITRTPVGGVVLADAFRADILEEYRLKDNSRYATLAAEKVVKSSIRKRKSAEKHLQKLGVDMAAAAY